MDMKKAVGNLMIGECEAIPGGWIGGKVVDLVFVLRVGLVEM